MDFLRKIFGKKHQPPMQSKPIATSQPIPSVEPQCLAPKKENLPVKDFFDAIDQDNFEGIMAIMENFPSIVTCVADRGRTPLHYAVTGKNDGAITKKIEIFMKSGADINAIDEDGNTPIYCAIDWTTNNTAVDILIAAGASLNNENREGLTPLHVACFRKRINAATALLNCNGINVNAKSKKGITPLMEAAKIGMTEIVDLLISKGADVNAKTTKKETPLHYAAAGGNVKIAQILLDHGAVINAITTDGYNALEIAGRSGYAEAYSFFHDKGQKAPFE